MGVREVACQLGIGALEDSLGRSIAVYGIGRDNGTMRGQLRCAGAAVSGVGKGGRATCGRLESTEPYGECMLVGKKKNPRKIQIDIIVYNKDLEEISAYEVKRGGSPHDRGKKESIISDVIAVQVLLKDYAEQKKFKVKKTKSLIISHYGATLTRPEWRDLQINGENIDNHFNANISSYLKETEEYWIKSFDREYKKVL